MKPTLDRRTLLASSAALAALAAAPGLALAQALKGPPVAPVRPVTETLWGQAVTDPYRWMEAQDAEWKTYTLAQAAWARQVLDAIPGRDALYKAIDANSGVITAIAGIQVGGPYIFIQKRPPDAETAKLYVREGPDGADRLLLDPDVGAAPGSHNSLDWWSCSPDGSHVAFGLSPGGSENSVLHVLETATGKLLSESIDRTENGSPGWTDDGTGFFYNRLQDVPRDSMDRFKFSATWFHRLNTDPATDVKVFAAGLDPAVKIADIDFPIVETTPGSPLAFGAVISGVQNEVALYASPVAAAIAGKPQWTQVCSAADKVTGGALHGEDFYLVTHDGASRYKIVKTSGAYAAGKVVVPESASVIRGATAARDALYIQDLNAGLGGIRRLAWDGTISSIKLPFDGAIDFIYADPLHDGCWFMLESWIRPPVLCRCGADGAVTVTNIAPAPPIDVSAYASEELMVPARDGVKVPLSIVYRKGLKRDGAAPLLLEAYGSYGITEDPGFLVRYLPFFDAGGVFALAHVRGGGELGEDWHLAGKLATKPNTWRDDIDCARWLIAQGYTSAPKLAIIGGSAGGITVGRFMTEEPKLAAVVIDAVGSSNALRAEFSPNGPPNVPEFGTVKDEAGFHALYEMDAYQHVKDGVPYPSVMLTTGLNDPRVSSWEPTKMTARLQAATSSKNPIILRVETDAGHGIGSTRAQRDHELADEFAFILWRTGDPRFQPK